nr:MAG TPA: hypothetical protein [Caudoviricetes sp.]
MGIRPRWGRSEGVCDTPLPCRPEATVREQE